MTCAMFLIGLTTGALAPLLIGNVIYTLTRIVIPATTLPGSLGRSAHTVVLCILAFGIVFNYVMSCGVDPGFIPKSYADAARQYLATRPSSALRVCHVCNVPKAPRSHHCSLSGRCVLRMDHFCVWVNGPVGYHNYRYFFGFLFWLLLGTIYTATLCAHLLWFHDESLHHAYEKVTSSTTQVFFVFVLTVAIAITMLLYVGFNLYGIFTNQTAVEFTIGKEISAEGSVYRNPYDIGWLANAVEFIGPETLPALLMKYKFLRLLHLIMPNIQLMPHEGVWYPTSSLSSSPSSSSASPV